jgi:hypothetical protein
MLRNVHAEECVLGAALPALGAIRQTPGFPRRVIGYEGYRGTNVVRTKSPSQMKCPRLILT